MSYILTIIIIVNECTGMYYNYYIIIITCFMRVLMIIITVIAFDMSSNVIYSINNDIVTSACK